MFVSLVKNKKLWIIGIFVALFIGWGSGFLTGWWAIKGSLGKFPPVDASTRLLVIAPHPDDEVLSSGGLIQTILTAGGKVKIVFLTNGDGSRSSVVTEYKKADLSPEEFLALGTQRIGEAENADKILGLSENDLVFLGFPDGGLSKLRSGKVTSVSTHFDHVPYTQSYKPSQDYSEENLVNDLKEIIIDFNPTLVITTHPKDHHPDHQAAYQFAVMVKQELSTIWPIYASLVHYKNYPPEGGYLFPPKKLFGGGWLSFEASVAEKIKELSAIKEYKSQYTVPMEAGFFNKLISTNEIFEVE